MLTERHSASPLIQGFLVLHGSDFKGNEASSNLNTQLDFASAIQLTAHFSLLHIISIVT